jgi:ADP-ribose pyrophosphatase YjhB (NUDIX family)
VLRIRPAGRVVLLDPDDRVLLMRYDDGPPNGVHWSTPGGWLNSGEDFGACAARELAEETGWDDIVLLGEIHRWTHTMKYDDAIVRQAERFFLARTDRPEREIDGGEAMHEYECIASWVWWTLVERDTTGVAIWSGELAELIRKALA